MENNIKQILTDLLQEEKLENDLISLYSMLLESGVENCLMEKQKEEFIKNLDILKNDSKRHKVMLSEIIAKYE